MSKKQTVNVELTDTRKGVLLAKLTYSNSKSRTLKWVVPGISGHTFKRLRERIEGNTYAVTKEPRKFTTKKAASEVDRVLTPYEALFWLMYNDPNQRPLKVTKLFSITDSIEKGNWDPTTDQVAFAEDGNLINGMHRVLAVILANPAKGVRLDVRKGATRSKYTDVDLTVRSPIDALVMSGHATSKILLSDQAPHKKMILRAARRIHTEATGLKNLPTPAFGEILEIFGEDFLALGPFYRSSGGNSTIKQGDVLAAFVVAHHYLDKKKVQQCVEKLTFNRGLPDDIQHPLQKLSRYLIDRRKSDQSQALVIFHKVLSGIIPSVDGKASGSISKDPSVTLRLVRTRSALLMPDAPRAKRTLPRAA